MPNSEIEVTHYGPAGAEDYDHSTFIRVGLGPRMESISLRGDQQLDELIEKLQAAKALGDSE